MKKTCYLSLLAVLLTGFASAKSVPVPLVNQPLVPDAAKPGASAFTLTLRGAGFVSSSAVKWNGKALKTSFVSGTELKAKVPSSDVAKAGTAAVSVVNPGKRVSNISYFQIIKPEKSLSLNFANYGVGSDPYSLAAGDFNGDGKLDLAVANVNDTTVSILLGNGDGTFQTQNQYQAGYAPIALGVGDLNGDGKLDLAVVNNGNDSNGHPGTVTILLGKGDGSFTTGQTFSTPTGPISIAVGDFNRDGKLDLAVAVYNISRGNTVSVLLGNGDGTFQKYASYDTGSAPESVAAADLNGDGILDLATANEVGGNVSVLLGKGDGTFKPHVDYPANKGPISVAIGDLNGDGKPDLAVVDLENFTVSVLLNKGDGTFGPHVDYVTGNYPVWVAIADFNADNHQDLAVVNQNNSGTVSILFGKGDGTFKTQKTFAAGDQPQGVAVGDFNGDGRLDLSVVDFISAEAGVLLQGK